MHLYSNIVLTAIAALLAVIAFRPAETPAPQIVQAPLPKVIDVNIVGASKTLPVDLDPLRSRPLAVSFVGKALPVSLGENPLRVTVMNPRPLAVSIFDSVRALPVVLKEGANPVPKAPLEVKIVGVEEDLPVTLRNAFLPVTVQNRELNVTVLNQLREPLDINISHINGSHVYGFPNYPLPVKIDR